MLAIVVLLLLQQCYGGSTLYKYNTCPLSVGCQIIFNFGNTCILKCENNAGRVLQSHDFSEDDSEIELFTNGIENWNLDRLDQRKLPLDHKFIDNHHLLGRNVSVYLLDTGLYTEHEEFVEELVSHGPSFVAGEDDGEDYHGHGTHIASIIVGQSFGIAREAKLTSIKVLDKNGKGTISNAIQGLSWILNNGVRPSVVSISFGGKYSEMLEIAVSALAADPDFVVVVAAGNKNDDVNNFSPSSSVKAFVVGSIDQKDTLSIWSNYGKNVDVFAPGEIIVGAWNESPTSSRILNGTSTAVPHVVGTLARFVEKHAGDLRKGVEDMTSNFVSGVLKQIPKGTPNYLVQIPKQGGPQAPPTPFPTRPPVSVCSVEKCYPFKVANFGVDLNLSTMVKGIPKEPPRGSNKGCEMSEGDYFQGHIAFVERGYCHWYTKAKNAMINGAIGVVLYNYRRETTLPDVNIPPNEALLSIPTVVVLYGDAKRMLETSEKVNGKIYLGSFRENAPAISPQRFI